MRTGWEPHAALWWIMRRFDCTGWCLLVAAVAPPEFRPRTWVWQDDRKPHVELSNFVSVYAPKDHPQFNGHLKVDEIGSSDWLILAIHVTWRITWELWNSNDLTTVTGLSQKHHKAFTSDYWSSYWTKLNQHCWTVTLLFSAELFMAKLFYTLCKQLTGSVTNLLSL